MTLILKSPLDRPNAHFRKSDMDNPGAVNKVIQLPFEVWAKIASYLSAAVLDELYSINRPLFELSLDSRYRDLEIIVPLEGQTRLTRLKWVYLFQPIQPAQSTYIVQKRLLQGCESAPPHCPSATSWKLLRERVISLEGATPETWLPKCLL